MFFFLVLIIAMHVCLIPKIYVPWNFWILYMIIDLRKGSFEKNAIFKMVWDDKLLCSSNSEPNYNFHDSFPLWRSCKAKTERVRESERARERERERESEGDIIWQSFPSPTWDLYISIKPCCSPPDVPDPHACGLLANVICILYSQHEFTLALRLALWPYLRPKWEVNMALKTTKWAVQ